jgi:hypothetical protein
LASQINASNSGFGGIVSTGDSSGVLQLQSAGTTAVTIDTSQNVGIGTTSPTNRLHVFGPSGDYRTALFESASTAGPSVQIKGSRIYELRSTNTGAGEGAGLFFIYDKTAEASRITINSSGIVTIPNQPAFFARKTNGGGMAPVNPVLFNDVVTNIGSYYNASTGRFTAPVAGTYYFISTAHCETTNNLDRKITIYVNGSLRAEAYVLNATGARVRIVNAAILVLAVNDYVTVGTSGASDFWAGDSTGINFTGHLIG